MITLGSHHGVVFISAASAVPHCGKTTEKRLEKCKRKDCGVQHYIDKDPARKTELRLQKRAYNEGV